MCQTPSFPFPQLLLLPRSWLLLMSFWQSESCSLISSGVTICKTQPANSAASPGGGGGEGGEWGECVFFLNWQVVNPLLSLPSGIGLRRTGIQFCICFQEAGMSSNPWGKNYRLGFVEDDQTRHYSFWRGCHQKFISFYLLPNKGAFPFSPNTIHSTTQLFNKYLLST